ncbi:hypothetical protein [Pseudoalteromonas sp. McH1-42]|uniref:hypothetical protein n=1 Tax=Pseudoalteromonas sp. McH1-42 TaxID=2917752 RepID=UPI001EF6921F|nr:hypothetical protein [Pseudoalteromonas sp. McH1-42]MCG7563046.1 hypothetical protein [Pseudoalteromonas sp. McH1-42]
MTSLFHFYGTYLAGLALNFEPKRARLLAKYAGQGVLQRVPQKTLNWHCDSTYLTPIQTGCADNNIDSFGPAHCKLAFSHLPAFGEYEQRMGEPALLLDEAGLSTSPSGRLAETMIKPQLNKLPAFLMCQPDSRFSRRMLNDVIFKSRYHNEVQRMSEALFGCRLYVYQSTWPLAHWPALCQSWLATCYALDCWQHNKPLKLFGNDWQMCRNARVQAIYRRLCAMYPQMIKTPNSVSRERLWTALLSEYKMPELADKGNTASRETAFLEQARRYGQITKAGRILALSQFRESNWYKFNLAATYHCNWLSRQLHHRGFNQFDTRQCLGSAFVSY